jgi:hypothetical protein
MLNSGVELTRNEKDEKDFFIKKGLNKLGISILKNNL